MKNNDNIAKEYLEKLGCKPIKILQGSGHPENRGLPDFRCSNNRYVEVKKLSRGHQSTQTIIQGNQFEVMKKLTRNGERVFLMILSPDCKEYDIFEIKHMVGKIKR